MQPFESHQGRPPHWFRYPPAGAELRTLTLTAADGRATRALLWRKRGTVPKAGVLLVHPRLDFSHHYTIPAFVEAGMAVLVAEGRGRDGEEVPLEELLLDVAAAMEHLKDEEEIEQVALLGNGAGGPLVAYYQAQALRAPEGRIGETPAGRPTLLRTLEMVPADAMIYLAAHRSDGHRLMQSIDPSVTDESDPASIDPALDLYAPDKGFVPGPTWSELKEDFVEAYREAQLARVQLLDAHARELIEAAREANKKMAEAGFSKLPEAEQRATLRASQAQVPMLIHRTMADPAHIDRSLDPSEREYGSPRSERPDRDNFGGPGSTLSVTPEAFLSTWSVISTNADMVANVVEINAPTLVVNAGKDRSVFRELDVVSVYEQVAAEDKLHIEFSEAEHDFEAPDEEDEDAREELMEILIPWLESHFEE